MQFHDQNIITSVKCIHKYSTFQNILIPSAKRQRLNFRSSFPLVARQLRWFIFPDVGYAFPETGGKINIEKGEIEMRALSRLKPVSNSGTHIEFIPIHRHFDGKRA